MLDKLGVLHQGIRKIMQKHTCKFTVGYNEHEEAVSACRGMHGKVVPDIKKRNTLVISVNYQVPRNHCFKYFTLVDTKVSHGHNARDCPFVDPPPCEVCHEIHQRGTMWVVRASEHGTPRLRLHHQQGQGESRQGTLSGPFTSRILFS